MKEKEMSTKHKDYIIRECKFSDEWRNRRRLMAQQNIYTGEELRVIGKLIRKLESEPVEIHEVRHNPGRFVPMSLAPEGVRRARADLADLQRDIERREAILGWLTYGPDIYDELGVATSGCEAVEYLRDEAEKSSGHKKQVLLDISTRMDEMTSRAWNERIWPRVRPKGIL